MAHCKDIKVEFSHFILYSTYQTYVCQNLGIKLNIQYGNTVVLDSVMILAGLFKMEVHAQSYHGQNLDFSSEETFIMVLKM